MGRVKGKSSLSYWPGTESWRNNSGGRHLWVRDYFPASLGNVTDDVIAQYIATQDLQERARDDDFTIGW